MFERLAPEQHDTLPDIPEPAENPALFGHEGAAQRLVLAYRQGRMPHALLLAGPQGIGKATFAYHLAHHLLKHPSAERAPDTLDQPDAASPLFRQIATGAHPSILHLTRPFDEKAKRFKTVVAVDEIRRVSHFLSRTSHDGSYRIVIVDPADDMNRAAANALLKNLEEPPARTVFFIIAHSLGALLPTIRSRCQVVRLQPLDEQVLPAVLEAVGSPLPDDPKLREALIERAEGSARNAILLTQYGGLEIAGTADAVISGASFDVVQAQRLGDALNARDAAIQFDIFNRHVLERIAGEARRAALSGNEAAANRLSELWQETSATIIDAGTYNLDKKQHVVGLLHRLQGAMRR